MRILMAVLGALLLFFGARELTTNLSPSAPQNKASFREKLLKEERLRLKEWCDFHKKYFEDLTVEMKWTVTQECKEVEK